jgi:hypothetical protein
MLSHKKDSILDFKIANEAIYSSKIETLLEQKYILEEQNIRLKKNRKLYAIVGFVGGMVSTYLIMR